MTREQDADAYGEEMLRLAAGFMAAHEGRPVAPLLDALVTFCGCMLASTSIPPRLVPEIIERLVARLPGEIEEQREVINAEGRARRPNP